MLIVICFLNSTKVFSQSYSILFGDTINRIDKNGKKQGFWLEKSEKGIFTGNYKNNLKVKGWKTYQSNGILISTQLYKEGKMVLSFKPEEGEVIEDGGYYVRRRQKMSNQSRVNKSRFIREEDQNKDSDSALHIRFCFQDQSIFSKGNMANLNSYIDSVLIKIDEIEFNKNDLDYRNPKIISSNIYDNLKSNVELVKSKKDTSRIIQRKFYYPVTLQPNREYLITFSKDKFLTKRIIVNTKLNLIDGAKLELIKFDVNLTNKVFDLFDPMIVGSPTEKYNLNSFGNWLTEDVTYTNIGKMILERKNDYEMKTKIVDIENTVNQQIANLKEKQAFMESEKKLKEEELKRIESDNKRKELELNLLAKEKSLSAIILKSKEAELIKNQALANEKKKEIENLNQQKIINELNIKNKERELIQKNIETENKQKQIQGLEKEKELSNENLKQQKFIQNLILAGSGLLAVFLVFVFVSLSKSRKANKIIALQQMETAQQKHLVEEKQKEIIESISYAKRLQEAILPPQQFVNAHLANNFIYYQPKDIVAGDFYWAEKVDSKFFIAAADSTGHGVPGAMVSVVCSNALNRTIKEFKLTETGKILDKTRELVLETFEKSASEVKDGMDISLLCIDSLKKEVFWSGANNPLWYIQNNELLEIKADKQPIGKTEYPKPFTTHQIAYKEGTAFYLFTDGLADQFGGPNGKKFKYKQFSELLLKSNNMQPQAQSQIINKAFLDWKGDLEQVDDVCVIGIKL